MTPNREYFAANEKEFLQFLKAKYKLFHLSNVFFRDLHYGVMSFLESRKLSSQYTEAETLTGDVIGHFVERGIFRPIDPRTWMLHYEEFRAVSNKPAPVQKPVPATKTVAPAATPVS